MSKRYTPWSDISGLNGMKKGNEAMEYQKDLQPEGIVGEYGSREWFESNERRARAELHKIAKHEAWRRRIAEAGLQLCRRRGR